MDLISSDTNVWIDFININKLDFPFLLPYKYIMYTDAITDELINPVGIGTTLIKMGLKAVELNIDELQLSDCYINKYPKLSKFDCIALAIAKQRNIELLTGDGALRKTAKKEDVKVFGTIGVLDRLYEQKFIVKDEYIYCIKALLSLNGKEIRLPQRELQVRLL